MIPRLALCILSAAVALAQDAFLNRWRAVHDAQPKAVEFAISVPKTAFYLGELVPLTLSFTSSQPAGYQADSRLYDRVGRMNYVEEFIVDNVASTSDPLQGLPGGEGGMGGLSGGPITLSAKPFVMERVLNEWMRFQKPGAYRTYVLSRRIFPSRQKPLQVVSNILTIHMRPAPQAWVKQQLEEATAILDTPLLPEEAPARRTRAGQVLRFLDTSASARELARRLGAAEDVNSYALHMGVLSSSHRSQLLPFLEARLVAPDQPVWNRYLNTLAHLAELVASGGPMPPYPLQEPLRQPWQEQAKQRFALQSRKRDEYISRLLDALPAKQAPARAVSAQTLLAIAASSPAAPSWLPRITGALIQDFHSLPAITQRDLLDYQWNRVKSPAMLPVLRAIYDHPPQPPTDPPLLDLALRRLQELDPGEARRIILAEIQNPTRPLRWQTLAMLPEASLPEADEALIRRLESGEWMDNLILRYATSAVVTRAEAAYERRREQLSRQNLPQCLYPLVFYFLRHDPAYGDRELRRIFAEPSAAPACHDLGFQARELGAHAMSPALEKLAIESLTSSSVLIKKGAAELLGRHGSVAARQPLWDTMVYFRNWWKGREEELARQEGAQLEQALRVALAQADGWVLLEPDLKRLLSLCSTDQCRQEVNQWLQAAGAPPEISVSPRYDGYAWTLAQYTLASEQQFRHKLSQYPRGATFRLTSSAGLPADLRTALQQAALAVRAAGHRIVP